MHHCLTSIFEAVGSWVIDLVETSPTDLRSASRPTGVPTYIRVQYLRAWAAIAVVVFHAAQRHGVDFGQGARGVDVFFVISGFIMWTVTNGRPTTPAGFLFDRVRRIVPLYWLATGAIIFAGVVGVVPAGQNDISLASILKSLFFVPYVAAGATEIWPILVPGWTLNYEMFFYAVFAAFLFAPVRYRLMGLTTTFIALILLGLVLDPRGPILATYTDALIGHFVAGVWISEAVRRGFSLPPVLSWLAILCGALALYLIPWGGVWVTLGCGAASTALVAGVVSMDLRRKVRTIPILQFAGDASYSIYLWHGFALSVVDRVAAVVGLPPALAITAGVVGGVVAGMIVYLVLEAPLRRVLSRRKRPSTR